MRDKTEKPTIRLIGLRHIVVDNAIQSRVTTSIEYTREFSEAILRGDQFPPIDVFWDGEAYWLADGFHRFAAHLKAGQDQIRCNVHEGSRLDAGVFSAGANKKFSIPRTGEDIKKAIGMLLALPDWLNATDVAIGAHVGVSGSTVSKHRDAYYAERGIDVPTVVYTKEGLERSYRQSRRGAPELRQTVKLGRQLFTARINGHTIRLGNDRKKAEKKLKEILAGAKDNTRGAVLRVHSKAAHHVAFMHRRGVQAKKTGQTNPATKGLGEAILAGGSIVTWTNFDTTMDIVFRVGQLVLLRRAIGGDPRMVILCPANVGNPAHIEMATAAGIEFLTPEQFVQSVKRKDSSEEKRLPLGDSRVAAHQG